MTQELHEIYREELNELSRAGVTPELLADEVDSSPHSIRSYGYAYEGEGGNGKTLRRVLRLAIVFARHGRPALLLEVCARAGYAAFPVPTGQASCPEAAMVAQAALRDCTEAISELLRDTADGVVTAGELERIQKRCDAGMAALATIKSFAERMHEQKGGA